MKQANTASEEELREKVDALLEDYFRPHHDYIYNANSTNDFLDAAIHLLHQYGNTRELEGRIDELKKTGGPNDAYENIGHLLASNVKERINELTKAKETPHET